MFQRPDIAGHQRVTAFAQPAQGALLDLQPAHNTFCLYNRGVLVLPDETLS